MLFRSERPGPGRETTRSSVSPAQTGLRASELIGLRCDDVHLAAGAHVSCQGKGRKQRITPLTSGLVSTLRIRSERLAHGASDGFALATDLAELLDFDGRVGAGFEGFVIGLKQSWP